MRTTQANTHCCECFRFLGLPVRATSPPATVPCVLDAALPRGRCCALATAAARCWATTCISCWIWTSRAWSLSAWMIKYDVMGSNAGRGEHHRVQRCREGRRCHHLRAVGPVSAGAPQCPAHMVGHLIARSCESTHRHSPGERHGLAAQHADLHAGTNMPCVHNSPK